MNESISVPIDIRGALITTEFVLEFLLEEGLLLPLELLG